ncbi:MAG: glycosyltransferase, partial [Candidatus Saccharimonadales bacterium]
MRSQAKPRLYIEALPLTTERLSGIGHSLEQIVRSLTNDKKITDIYDVILFGPEKGRERVLSRDFKHATYKSYRMPQKLFTVFNLLGLLPPIDRRFGRGVYLFGNYVNYPLTKRSRSITYVHDISYLRYPEHVRPKVRRILEHYVPQWIRRTNQVVTVSGHAKHEIVEAYHLAAERVLVVPNGIDTAVSHRRSSKEVAEVKKRYGIEGEYVLYLGNKEPRKNLQRLVEAYALLS